MARPTALLLGHSFVSGLDHHLQNRFQGGDYGRYVARELRVDAVVERVYLGGLQGARATNYYMPEQLLGQIQPDIVVLDLGSNDIGYPLYPTDRSIADHIMYHAESLVTHYGVRDVRVCSLLPRAFVFEGPVEVFNNRIYEINRLLIEDCYKLSLLPYSVPVHYHLHCGFWRNTDGSLAVTEEGMAWSADGIHANNAIGRAKYKASIRTALHRAVKDMI